jgi:CTD small phosphatase-like protein 2
MLETALSLLPLAHSWLRAPPPRISVILDLDNTLVHSTLSPSRGHDFAFDFSDGGRPATVFVQARPHLRRFLRELSEFADLHLFTAGTADYVWRVLELVDPSREVFRTVLTREDCTPLGPGRYAKDYEKCGTDMDRTFVVDDNPGYFGKWAAQGFAIEPFVGQPGDAELIRILRNMRARCEAMNLFS